MTDLWEIAVRLSSSCFTAATVGLSYESINPLKKKKKNRVVASAERVLNWMFL